MTDPVLIYCDGSAYRGDGGVGVVLLRGDRCKEYSLGVGPDFQPRPWLDGGPTNQQMELLAAIVGLGLLKDNWRGKPVVIRSDSAYVVNCFRDGWYVNWRRKGWIKSGGGEVANRALWETLLGAVELFDVTFEHVKGHNGDTNNERADRLATTARRAIARRAS